MTGPINPDGLIHDLAILVAGSLHPSAKVGPAPRLAARRMQDVLGIADGETVAGIERELRAVLDVSGPSGPSVAAALAALRAEITRDAETAQELGDGYSEMGTDPSWDRANRHWGRAEALREVLATMDRMAAGR